MLVADLRQRVLEKVEQAATGGDEEGAAVALAHARAVLVALVRHREDDNLTLQDLTVGTGTAALILGMHPEYVRNLIRQDELPATKENAEFRIALSAVSDFMATKRKSLSSPESRHNRRMQDLLQGRTQWPATRHRPSGEAHEPGRE